jgi:quinolinate synthase
MLETLASEPAGRLPLPELYSRVERHVPPVEWPVLAEDIAAILKLKRERNAAILAHNYQTPDIFHTVGDIVGDSLALAREAARTDAGVIVLAGVHFMAETAKLLNPEKTVLIPDTRAGCSLAESITAADVRLMRERHPGVPIVTYVNTSAAVKAESDICCTSGNAKKIVEGLGVPKVIMIPDEYLARNIAAQTTVEIIAWKGHCEVHERFTTEDIRSMRENYPGVTVLAHPECPPEVVAECDFTGSTAAMADYVGQNKPARVVLLTECSMSDNVALQYPELEFVRPCNLCPHMKRITLKNIRHALETMTHEVTVAPEIAEKARRAVERMLAFG